VITLFQNALRSTCSSLIVLAICLAISSESLANQQEQEQLSELHAKVEKTTWSQIEIADLLVNDMNCRAIAYVRTGVKLNKVLSRQSVELFHSTDFKDFKPRHFRFQCRGESLKLPSKASSWEHRDSLNKLYKLLRDIRYTHEQAIEKLSRWSGGSRSFKFSVELLVNTPLERVISRTAADQKLSLYRYKEFFEGRAISDYPDASKIKVDEFVKEAIHWTETDARMDQYLRFLQQAVQDVDRVEEITKGFWQLVGVAGIEVPKSSVEKSARYFEDLKAQIWECHRFILRAIAINQRLHEGSAQKEVTEALMLLRDVNGKIDMRSPVVRGIAEEVGMTHQELLVLAAVTVSVTERDLRILAQYTKAMFGSGVWTTISSSLAES